MPRRVHIALLSYSPHVHAMVKNACIAAASELNGAGYQTSLSERIGDAMLPRARNAMVSEFLARGDDDLIMIDSDNYCEPKDFVRLVQAPADIVGLPCRGKQERVTWPIRWLHKDIEIRADGLIEVDSVGTGIIKCTRDALLKMVESGRWKSYQDASSKVGRSTLLFEFAVVDDCWWGEDLVFCRRWRELGGKIFIIPDIKTWHLGIVGYEGSVGDWLATMPEAIVVDDVAERTASFIANPLSKRPPRVSPQPRRIAVALPTRGRPQLLRQTVATMLVNARLKDTRIIVGLDGDDPDIDEAISGLETLAPDRDDPRIVISVDEREDSLGAKWNRCARAVDADLFVVGADDATFPNPSWDVQLLDVAAQFDDGIGCVFFGDIPNVMQPGIAITQRMIALVGGLAPEDYPFWWTDTYWAEIGRLCSRIRNAPTQVKLLGELKAGSRGVRDIQFWAELFYRTRPSRVLTAHRIIDACDNTAELNQQLLARIPDLVKEFEATHDCLRGLEKAHDCEAFYSFDAPADERYLRIKKKAQAKMTRLMTIAEGFDVRHDIINKETEAA